MKAKAFHQSISPITYSIFNILICLWWTQWNFFEMIFSFCGGWMKRRFMLHSVFSSSAFCERRRGSAGSIKALCNRQPTIIPILFVNPVAGLRYISFLSYSLSLVQISVFYIKIMKLVSDFCNFLWFSFYVVFLLLLSISNKILNSWFWIKQFWTVINYCLVIYYNQFVVQFCFMCDFIGIKWVCPFSTSSVKILSSLSHERN